MTEVTGSFSDEVWSRFKALLSIFACCFAVSSWMVCCNDRTSSIVNLYHLHEKSEIKNIYNVICNIWDM